MKFKLLSVRLIGLAGLFAVLMSLSSLTQAGLIGSQVNVSAFFPNTSTLFDDPGNVTVGTGIEYAAGSYFDYNPRWEIDIANNQLSIIDTANFDSIFSSDLFNGWVLSVISGPAIVSASVDPTSGFAPFALNVVGGDLFLNYQSVQAVGGLTSIINFATSNDPVPVPEPTGLALLAAGFIALRLAKRNNVV